MRRCVACQQHARISQLTHIQATCSRFYQSCQSKGILLDKRGFKLSYETTIPRQLGLSGSSALVCATFNCLLHWFDLHQDWPVPRRPQFVLDVETEELGITGGLMDRVAQVRAPSRHNRPWHTPIKPESSQLLQHLSEPAAVCRIVHISLCTCPRKPPPPPGTPQIHRLLEQGSDAARKQAC